MDDSYYCETCRLWLQREQLEFGLKHRIIVQNGPDVFHGVRIVNAVHPLLTSSPASSTETAKG